MARPPCPCGSGTTYNECCRPFHQGQTEPPTAERLMRSRFSAFALKEVAYLWKTLHPQHVDRQRLEADVLRELRATCQKFKFVSLEILEAVEKPVGETSTVTFRARVFETGKDVSFTEKSDFQHDGQGWRYVAGHVKGA